MNKTEPLAYRMRPKTLEEYEGQEHVIGPGKILYRTIKADRLSSIILFGPPGCGKTSLAKVISETTKYKFYRINAVTSGVSDIKRIVEETQNFMMNPAGKSILFIDEIHRFNKLQQDALLPFVENGTIILIGATTENPYFEVNKALISRSMVIKLNPLTEENMRSSTSLAILGDSLSVPARHPPVPAKRRVRQETHLRVSGDSETEKRTFPGESDRFCAGSPDSL